MLGIDESSDNPASIAERHLNKRNYQFGKDEKLITNYFIKESEIEMSELNN